MMLLMLTTLFNLCIVHLQTSHSVFHCIDCDLSGLQTLLDTVYSFYEHSGLAVYVNKTKVTVVTTVKYENQQPATYYEGEAIEAVHMFTHLRTDIPS